MTPATLQKVSPNGWDWAEMRSFCFKQALRVVDCPETADDAAQEAIVRAWCHRESCRMPEQPFGWLRRIAHNEAVRAACRRPNEVLVSEPRSTQNAALADDATLEDRLLFGRILGTLSQADQELAWLRYYEDLTCARLAERLGLSEATVKVRLHRLRQKLRQRMEAQT
jgi:RNA polymerase sigma-70 factor (ECF subfamily)